MQYSNTEIELLHNRGYLQALKHVMGYIEQFNNISSVKSMTNGLIAGTESAITRLETDIESEHEAEYQEHLKDELKAGAECQV